MASTKTYSVSGNREDLSDIVTLLEPEATPFVSMAKKATASGTFFEWQTDNMATPSFAGVLEGEDASSFDDKAANRAKLGNHIQKLRKTYAVSDLQEIVDTAGVASEFASAESKAVRELKRDLESAVCSAQDRQADDGTNPYKTRGMLKWLGVGGQPADVPSFAQNVANDTSSVQTETTFNNVLQELYEANGMPGGPLTLIAGPGLKREISNFARQEGSTTAISYQVTQPAESKKITLSVSTYEGDYGLVNIVPSVFINRTSGSATVDADAGLLIDPEYVGIHMLKAESTSELENRGGGRRGFADLVAGLACYSPKAHGYFN